MCGPEGRSTRITGSPPGLAASLAVALALSSGTVAHAQANSFPTKPITVLIGFPPGSTTDRAARLIAEPLSQKLGQPVVVENKPGAGGIIAAGMVARAAPDGYTLLLSGQGPILIAPVVNPKAVTFDTLKDLAPVGLVQKGSYVLSAQPGRFASVTDFLDKARAKPNTLTYGTSGVGTSSHLLSLTLEESANIKMTHIPYKGTSQVLTDVVGGQLDVALEPLTASSLLLSDKRLVPLAVTGENRSSHLPSVPTFKELGLADLEGGAWIGFFAPGGTPQDILKKIHVNLADVLQKPEIVQQLSMYGSEVLPLSPDEFASMLSTEAPKQAELVRKSGVTIE